MKYCIIGAGAFGINIAFELLSKGHQVDMFTDKLESVSSIYSRGIAIKMPKHNWFTNIYFKMNNYNYQWLLLWAITTYANYKFYFKFKKKAIVESFKIVKSYNLNYQMCKKKYFIDIPYIHNEMINNMKNNNLFNLIIKKLIMTISLNLKINMIKYLIVEDLIIILTIYAKILEVTKL